MATIGLHRAVAELGNKTFSGLTAWLLWSVVHVLLLIGFRSRVTVMRQWVWAYATRAGSSPLITEHQGTETRKTDHYVSTGTLSVVTPLPNPDGPRDDPRGS
jgi:NADH:ubiquinone reductase (H+-translocating)